MQSVACGGGGREDGQRDEGFEPRDLGGYDGFPGGGADGGTWVDELRAELAAVGGGWGGGEWARHRFVVCGVCEGIWWGGWEGEVGGIWFAGQS